MKARRRTSMWFLSAAPLLALVAVAGCSVPKASDFKPSKLFSLGDEDEPEKGTPVRMVGTWTDTVLTQPGQKSQRGFGGRLVFYGRKEEKPILVEGQLVVYAFDETGRKVTDNRPTRRYVFPADQMPLHMSKSEIGASYSFWLPWDEAGGPQTDVSLICRFEPTKGSVVTSEQTRHRLPGNMPTANGLAPHETPKLPEGVPSKPAQVTLESLQAARQAAQGAQQASYESVGPVDLPIASTANATLSQPEAPRRMTTTSITLPKGFQLPASAPSAQPSAPANIHTPNLMPVPQQASPIPTSQTSTDSLPASPLQRAGSLNNLPTTAQPQAFQSTGYGAMPVQTSMMQRPAAPTSYSPMISGLAAAAQPQQIVAPTGRAMPWNTQQMNTAQMPVQNQPQSPMMQPQMIQHPASQPLPAPSPLTTTVTPPPAAALVR
jgi:hypothetical protein